MPSLTDKAILSGADNRPPMLEKDMYDSWKSIMELYMLNRQHGRMILESVENGPLLWPTVEENGVTWLKKYSELLTTKANQADCDIKATNIILQGLPPEQKMECKLYDEFDKFTYRKGESLSDFYLRFSLLLSDINIYNMKLEQFQGEGHMSKQCTKPKRKRDEAWFKEKIALMANLSHYGSDNLAEAELSAEQAFWSRYSVQPEEPNLSASTTIVEVPKELPKVSMVNSSLKKLKFHLASFDMVVKGRTTATAIKEGTWGFEHTKACFRDDIQNVFHQMEQAIEQHCVEKNKFQDKMKNVLKDNDQLLEKEISIDIVNIVVYYHVNFANKTVNVCERCVPIKTKIQKNFINKECYDTLFKKFNTLEKHCISLEVDNQLKKEIFQRNNSFSKQSAPTFDQLFEINDLKAQSQEKDTVIVKLKEGLKSLSEQCDDLIKQVNSKFAEVSDLNASLQEKVLVITALKETLSKFKGKAIVNEVVPLHSIDPELLKIDVAPLAPKLRNNKIAHTNYLRHTQEETTTLREIVESERLVNLLNTSLDYACKYTKCIQELLIILQQTCPCITELGNKLMAVTPKNNDKKIRLTKHIPSSGKTTVKTTPSTNLVSNTHVLSFTRVNLLSSASGSQPQGNTKNDRIQ
nr:hypothetical protein [Tanacetum cinerariifolium]